MLLHGVIRNKRECRDVGSVERRYAGLGERTHPDDVSTQHPKRLLVVAPTFEKGTAHHRVRPRGNTSLEHTHEHASYRVNPELRDRIFRGAILSRVEWHVWCHQRHEAVDHYQVANVDARLGKCPCCARHDQLRNPELHQGFGLQPNHLMDHGVCRSLVKMNATTQTNDRSTSAYTRDERPVVSLEVVEMPKTRHVLKRDLHHAIKDKLVAPPCSQNNPDRVAGNLKPVTNKISGLGG
ncbi:MAG: hypothetical protein G01um101477_188 [Candidatus Doudnabacteria bacterium Gr01-1014_77]|uniref:Uncharacterized protein n=1 Tax=Candidatus Doudnabacteria bacterium Gr01-1014_77 TaxID=2017133 RepID=A0A554JCR0_9BACT|nr:MAG: hypothetical protein G01um101477_188 [Candidatus Doudnabacteria bacterium Gr01-1014_77]